MNVVSLTQPLTSALSAPTFISNFEIILAICTVCIAVSALLGLAFGKRAVVVRSVTVSLGILISCLVCFILSEKVSSLSSYIVALPFVSFGNGTISVFPLMQAARETLYVQLLNLILLCFLFGLFDDLLPEGKSFISWFLLRCVCILCTYVSFSIVTGLITRLLPDVMMQYAPVILLGLLALFLAVTVFKWLIGLILGISGGPVLGAIYTLFISHIVGKQLTKSALSAGILTGLAYLANRYEMTAIVIETPYYLNAIPLIALLAGVWYLIHKAF